MYITKDWDGNEINFQGTYLVFHDHLAIEFTGYDTEGIENYLVATYPEAVAEEKPTTAVEWMWMLLDGESSLSLTRADDGFIDDDCKMNYDWLAFYEQEDCELYENWRHCQIDPKKKADGIQAMELLKGEVIYG